MKSQLSRDYEMFSANQSAMPEKTRLKSKDLIALKKIRAIAMDVDGVLTDGTFWWDTGELELKRFCFADITGIPLAQKAGVFIGLISGESSASAKAIVDRYAKKLKIQDVVTGCHDKAGALRLFAEKHGLDLTEVCFMGDDINDLPALNIAGLSAAPSNAHPSVLETVTIVVKKNGGHGAVREIIDIVLSAQAGTSNKGQSK